MEEAKDKGQMNRINKILESINESHMNPFAMNLEYGLYEFERLHSLLKQLDMEIFPFIDGTNERGGKKDIMSHREKLKKALKEHPPFEEKRRVIGNKEKREKIPSKENWEKVNCVFEEYESLLRRLLEENEEKIYTIEKKSLDKEANIPI